MQISLLFLTKVFPDNSDSIFISKVAPLEELPQWESKGDEDLPWDNLWGVGTQLPLVFFVVMDQQPVEKEMLWWGLKQDVLSHSVKNI